MLLTQTPISRIIALVIFLAVIILTILTTYGSSSKFKIAQTSSSKSHSQHWIVNDINKPLTVGCEDVVASLQSQLIEGYSESLKDIRYANLWGYLGPMPLIRLLLFPANN
jgi:hypothetical protein